MKIRIHLTPRKVVALALSVFLVLFLAPLPEQLLHPGGWLFSSGRDGYKNYLTLQWYLDHDSGLEFSGYNFPMGYHYLLTDGHVPLGMLLKALGVPGCCAVGAINFCMVLSIPLSAWLYFLLFRRMGLSDWVALCLGAAIIFMSPQWPRLNGHYALSYMWCFPLLGLFALGYRSGKRPWLVCGGGVGHSGGYLHASSLFGSHLHVVGGGLFWDADKMEAACSLCPTIRGYYRASFGVQVDDDGSRRKYRCLRQTLGLLEFSIDLGCVPLATRQGFEFYGSIIT